MDRLTLNVKERWLALLTTLLFFLFRVYQTGDLYAVIAYLLGLFYLNQIMLYLSPLVDPEDNL